MREGEGWGEDRGQRKEKWGENTAGFTERRFQKNKQTQEKMTDVV